jgi:WD40 repeat protein
MARIFISHSSADNDQAAQMKAWLASAGFESAFLDKDKTTGIPPGADWERTLYREVEQSQAVIIVQTPNWLASKWCFAEFTQARALGKAIFPAIVAPTGDTLISPDIQALNLLSDHDGGLERLKRELVRIALDAQGGFTWDSNRPPFPGLLAFDEEDAAVYFGRDDDIRRLIERLEARRAQGGAKLIALLGSSGSGKSSLLRAGVIPRLKRGGHNWIVTPAMRPRLRPVDELASALAAARNPPVDWAKVRDELVGSDPVRALNDFARSLQGEARANEAHVLIPIDQAEELFGAADADEARRFLAILSQALSESLPFMAVMTIRSDFLGQLQSATSLTARFEEFSLGPMPLARISQIIEGPAHRTGLSVEEEFVQQAARDAETEDALPLLAFTLRELFDKSKDESLTLQAYQALGDAQAGLSPLENAVRKRADEVLAEARPADDELMALREAFVPAMVRINDKGDYVRRPAPLDALPAKSHALLERLAEARLLIVRQDGDSRVIEVAHEALLRKWPRLRSWLDASREFLIGKQQLEQDLRDWEAAPDKDRGEALLTGMKLSRARGWLIEHPAQLTDAERAFIQTSIERDEAQKHSRERTRRFITWGSAAVALILAMVAGLAVWQMIRAQASEGRAKIAQDAAVANESKALTGLSQAASLQGHYTDAVKLALAAWPRSAADEHPESSAAIDALGQALKGPLEISPPLQHADTLYAAGFSPDSTRVVTASADSTAQVWDAATGKKIGKPLRHVGRVWTASFSPDGAWVVTASEDRTAQVWDAANGERIGKPLRHKAGVVSASFSPNGARVVTASEDRTAQVWDAKTGVPIGKPMRHKDVVRSASFSPDGERVVTASGDTTAQVWKAADGEKIGDPMQHNDQVFSAAFSPDGARVVTASEDRTAQVWDAATGERIGEPLRHEAGVVSAAFSPDGARVVTASKDRSAQIWDATTGARIAGPLEHKGEINSARFNSNGKLVVTASDDGTAKLWNAETGAAIGKPLQHWDIVNSAVFSADGKRVVTASVDASARLWSAVTGAPIYEPLQHTDQVFSAAFSPNGARVVTASADKTAQVWNAANGEKIGDPLRHNGKVDGAAFSPDGERVVTASEDRTAQVWNVATGKPIGEPMRHNGFVQSALFSPDGERVVTASSDNTARVWNAKTGKSIGKPMLHKGSVIGAEFSPDGERVVTASSDNTAQVWDAETAKSIGKAMQHLGVVYRASFSPDSKRVVTASWDNTARVWDAATGEPIGNPLRHLSRVFSASFSPDGARVVTGAFDHTAQVWDAATGEPIGKPLRHGGGVDSAVFSPDGTRVLTASLDNTARVWDATRSVPIGDRLQHEGRVFTASFSPDGTRVVTVSVDKTARVWMAPTWPPNIIATACEMLGANHDTGGLADRYGVKIKDPICTADAPAPDPSLMIEH